MIHTLKVGHLAGHTAAIYNLSKGAHPAEIFSCGSDRVLLNWNLNLGVPQVIATFPMAVYSILYIHSKQLLLAGLADGGISIVDLIQKKEVKILQHHHAPIFDLTYSAVNSCIVAASADGAISFIDAETLTCFKIVKLCTAKIRNLALNAAETELAVACGDGSIRLFEMQNQKEKISIEAHQDSANCVLYHPNGKFLLSGGKDAHLCVWKCTDTGELILHTKIPAHNFALYSLAFHPDGNYFASGSRDKTIKIWDAHTFEFLLRINKENYEGHLNSVNKILWTSYKNWLISAGDDRAILLWELME
ncbi:MAG: WD40 repeat domain-containing protein [Bacteroidetes bacterium]|nr:WD40 repeat domain-containing protein [Bacteroidota bacterium]